MKNNISLFIDCTGEKIILALLNKKNIIDQFVRETNKDMIEHVISDIDTIIKKHNLDKTDIKKIYWISNPGLFTGIRVASLIIKAWTTYNKKIKIYEINKLIFQANENCYSLLDAKGSSYYCAKIIKNKIIDNVSVVKDIKELNENLEIIIDKDFDFDDIFKKIKLFKKINIKKFHLSYFKNSC